MQKITKKTWLKRESTDAGARAEDKLVLHYASDKEEKNILTFFRKRQQKKVDSIWCIINLLSPDSEKIVEVKIHIY